MKAYKMKETKHLFVDVKITEEEIKKRIKQEDHGQLA